MHEKHVWKHSTFNFNKNNTPSWVYLHILQVQNQWVGFYMIETFVRYDLNRFEL